MTAALALAISALRWDEGDRGAVADIDGANGSIWRNSSFPSRTSSSVAPNALAVTLRRMPSEER